MVQKQRILYWDVIKAFAIFLVVWGHCLQYLQVDTEKCWSSNLCGFIYSFHMPLFMMVSGFFAKSIYKKGFWENIKHKTIQIWLPSVTTYIVVGLLLIYIRHEPWGYGLTKLGWNCFTSYWFLKALYILYIVGICFTFVFRKSKLISIALSAILLVLLNDNVEFVHCMSMAPFFLIGMFLYKCENLFWKNKVYIAIICLIVCCVMGWIYDIVDYNMYMRPFRWDFQSLYLFLIRMIIGTAASFLSIIMIRSFCDILRKGKLVQLLAKIGGMTLGIYVFHREMALLSNRFASRIESLNIFNLSNVGGQIFYEYGICLFATLIFMAISIAIILVLRKNKYTRLIFLGEK